MPLPPPSILLLPAPGPQAVIKALPEGWTLLTSLHLLGVDGQVLTDQTGCKYEVDMLVLDERGVAVAIIEGRWCVHGVMGVSVGTQWDCHGPMSLPSHATR
jgi:hypothetical protein